MLKKYLFSDAEKASVEREIEIQQVCLPPHTADDNYRNKGRIFAWRLRLIFARGCCATGEVKRPKYQKLYAISDLANCHVLAGRQLLFFVIHGSWSKQLQRLLVA